MNIQQQPYSNPHQWQQGPPPRYLFAPRNQQYAKQSAQKFFLACLGLLVVLNLNILGAAFLGSGQIFSPAIMLVCIILFLRSRVSVFKGIPRVAQFFGSALLFVIFFGVISGLANGLTPREMASTVISDGATVVVFFTSVVAVQSLARRGGKPSEEFVLKICFWLACAATASIFIPLVLPKWQYWVAENKNPDRFSGMFGNSNAAAAAAISFMVFGFARTAYDKKLKWTMISSVLAIIAVYMTGSRSGILSAVLVGFCTGLLVFKPREFLKLAFVVMFLGVTFATLFQVIRNQAETANDKLARRYAETLEMMQGGGMDDNSTGGRLGLAQVAWEQYKTSPIIGTGIGSARPMPRAGLGPHDYYLAVLVETGITGLLPFLIFWALVGLSVFRLRGDQWKRVLVVGIFLSISLAAAASHTTFTQRNQVFLLGCAIGLLPLKTKSGRRL